MDKQSILYQLMDMCMNSIMNRITEQDEDFQTLLRAVDIYSDRLEFSDCRELLLDPAHPEEAAS